MTSSASDATPGSGPDTRLIHHAYTPPAGFSAPQPAVHKASTVIFPDVAAMRSREWKDKTGYTYGLHGTPTTYMLEERLCEPGGRPAVRADAQRPRGHRQRGAGAAAQRRQY